MPRRVVKTASLVSVADKIREKSGSEDDLLFPGGFEDGVDKVFSAGEAIGYEGGYGTGLDDGYSEGYSDGYTDGEHESYTVNYNTGYEDGYSIGHDEGRQIGYEEGAQAEHDRFWDAYQQNGTRTDYNRAFREFNDATFRPKYDIQPTDATYAFYNSLVTDLKGILEECGVALDFSKCTAMTQVFMFSTITRLPTIDVSSLTNFQVFTHCHDLVSVDKVILNSNATFTNPFHTCTALKHMIIEGVISNNGVNFQWSTKLDKASITSVVNALSTTTSGLSIALSKTAVNNAFTDTEWATLANTRSNWTINLV